MKIIGDYHTHTIYSSYPKPSNKHAKGTIRENAEVALSKGLEYLAITEHGPSHYIYGVNKKYIPEMRLEIDSLNKEFIPKGLKILLGIEANLISTDGSIDINEDIEKYLDFVIVGYHYGAMPKSLKDIYNLYILQTFAKITGLGKNKAKKIMTESFIRAIEKNKKIKMISHPGSKAAVDIYSLAQVAEKNKVALEISSKHSELSIENLKKIKDLEIELLLNSDAHCPEDVGNVQIGLKKAIDSGIDLGKIKNLDLNNN